MPQLGRVHLPVQDAEGDAVSGASVTIYREGATVNGNPSGTSPLTVTVHNNGRIAAADTVFINTTTSTVYNVSSTTATTVVLSGFSGSLSLTDGDRLIPGNSLPDLYSDDQGVNAIGNPLTTNSVGVALAYAAQGVFDAIVTGSSVDTKLYQSILVWSEAPGVWTSDIDDSASAVAFIRDTANQLSTSGALLEDLRNLGNSKWKVGYDGSFTATGSAYIYGTATASGFYSPLGVFTNITATSWGIPASTITTTMLAANAVHAAVYIASGTTASATADASQQTRVSTTWTPSSGNVGAFIFAQANYRQVAGNTGDYLSLRLLVNGNVRVTKRWLTDVGAVEGYAPFEAAWFEASMSTSTVATAAFADIETGGTANFEYRGDYDPARIFVIELKR